MGEILGEDWASRCASGRTGPVGPQARHELRVRRLGQHTSNDLSIFTVQSSQYE